MATEVDADIAQIPGIATLTGDMSVLVFVAQADGSFQARRVSLAQLSAWLQAN